ncbi:hypothetical protein HMPREF9372_0165 [Sporosarcina newyorkensis 2681]|uniref:Uncharacterized protein n=1 Tax=Sporosarcina newyorkensis 2681 TaxID=1027292 RepID=F9DMY5_9BACL|nr:hypothetical protein HMPREF9372_0165 [Sporosarcina newyorkensis 2681]
MTDAAYREETNKAEIETHSKCQDYLIIRAGFVFVRAKRLLSLTLD